MTPFKTAESHGSVITQFKKLIKRHLAIKYPHGSKIVEQLLLVAADAAVGRALFRT